MKGRRPWHKRYHEDALNGYSKLNLEERGVYTTILDLYYSRGGPLSYQDASDERWLACWCGCSTRLLRPIIERLIGKGKLTLRAGTLVNDRASKELGLLASVSEQREDAGREGGLASGVARRNEAADPEVQPRFSPGSTPEPALNQPRTERETGVGKSDINDT